MVDQLLQGLLLLAVGMVGVMLSLTLLAGMISVLKLIDERTNTWKIRRYEERIALNLPDHQPSDELIAVLSAAAHITLARRIRIHRVRLFDAPESGAWASTGRLNIMASHQIARRKS
jgi:Na+-transporting methylmalonyl-CoA/oxaloacetate decarboxylase gamma subunit